MITIDQLHGLFNNRIYLEERQLNLFQLYLPIYHEDGDMLNIYLKELDDGRIRVCDLGATYMRLSYAFDELSPHREELIQRILNENQILDDAGNLYFDAEPGRLAPAVMSMVQVITKITSMQFYRQDTIINLFYEQLAEYIIRDLGDYSPQRDVVPLSRDELIIDWTFQMDHRPIFLFGINDVTKARLATITCLELRLNKVPFRSLMIHRDFSTLPKKDINRITSVADKQFPSLDDFILQGAEYMGFERAALERS